ncbi:MAG: hypothetical protein H7Z41_01600 [Cytophagales bacterium]|nr:hypothetical protein [Armatimonadota bacterium]
MTSPRIALTRRLLIRTALGGATAAALTGKMPGLLADTGSATTGDARRFLRGEALFRDVEAYAALGEHRTATSADKRTGEWLAENLRRAGFKPEFLPFTTRQFFPETVRLEVGGRAVSAFPLWFSKPTGTADLSAPLAMTEDSKDRIALVSFPFDHGASFGSRFENLRRVEAAIAAGAKGIIAVTEGPTGELIALNVSPSQTAIPIPVLLVGGREGEWLQKAAAQGAPTRLRLQAREEAASAARGVVATYGSGPRRIVVSTPQSGWFRCAGERGPGIALFLALARWAAARSTPGVTYEFLSNTGHEIGGTGMQNYLRTRAPKPGETAVWLHLGAGIATYDWEAAKGSEKPRRKDTPYPGRRLTASPDLIPLLTKTFETVSHLTPNPQPVGELVLVLRAGYRAFGIAGDHPFHHTPADLPRTTSPALLEPVALALAATLDQLGKGDPPAA